MQVPAVRRVKQTPPCLPCSGPLLYLCAWPCFIPTLVDSSMYLTLSPLLTLSSAFLFCLALFPALNVVAPTITPSLH